MFYHNIASLAYKCDALLLFLEAFDCKMLCFSEHWATGNEIYAITLPGFDLCSHFSRGYYKHGGVAIYLRNGVRFVALDVSRFCEELHAEFCCVTVPEVSLTFVTVYRSSTHGNFRIFFAKLDCLLMFLTQQKLGNLVILGDFNVGFNDVRDSDAVELICLFNSYGLYRQVFDDTRVTQTGGSCLDNVFVNIQEDYCHTELLDPCLSDHKAIGVRISNGFCQVNNKHFVFRRVITSSNIVCLRDFLQSLNWEPYINSQYDIQTTFNSIVQILNNFIVRNCPLKKCSVTTKLVNWFTPELRNMRDTVSALQTVYNVTKSHEDLARLRTFKSLYLQEIKVAKREKYSAYILNSSNVSRTAWQVVNFETSRKKRYNECPISAEELSRAFTLQVEEIMGSFSQANESALDYFVGDIPSNSFFFVPITESEILRAIHAQRNSSSSDCFEINIRVLRGVADIVSPIFAVLFNRCVEEGVFPDILKVAKITPVFKKGAVTCTSNYRPIAIVPLIGKIFEYLIKDRLCQYFESKHLFNTAQFGFRAARSTGDAVGRLLGGIVEGFEKGNISSALLFDLKKAFDCVTHDILLCKLERYGVRGIVLQLLASYLSDRRQYVCVGTDRSGVSPVKFGVPQGSILGPLLFIVYINDLPSYIKAGRMTLFADDTTVLISGKNHEELDRCALATEGDIKNWFAANRLLVNDAKTQKIVFSLNPRVYLNVSVRLLGVVIDDSLRWTGHIDQLCDTLSQQIFVLRQLRDMVGREVLLATYHALFHSRLKYCVRFWGNSTYACRVFVLQKRAIRTICRVGSRHSCRDLFKELKILTLSSEFIMASLLEVRKNVGRFPSNSDYHGYNTRRRNDLATPALRLEASRRNTLDVNLFNRVPNRIRQLNVFCFKKRVKSYLLSHTFYSCREFLESPPWPSDI